MVDPERKRIALTAKKTLLESDLPIVSKFEDARPGVVAHAVVFRVSEKHVMVEFFNNMKALVPIKEARLVTLISKASLLTNIILPAIPRTSSSLRPSRSDAWFVSRYSPQILSKIGSLPAFDRL